MRLKNLQGSRKKLGHTQPEEDGCKENKVNNSIRIHNAMSLDSKAVDVIVEN